MGKNILCLSFFGIFLMGPACYAQTAVKISDPKLEIRDNTLHISYDLLNSDPSEKYIIGIEITDEDGNPVNASALDGDIGPVEDGGRNKQITWNLEADNIFINAYLYVKLNAEVILPPEPEIAQLNEQTDDSSDPGPEKDISIIEPVTEGKTTSYNRTALVLQSLLIPGLGLSRVTGNPHWIRGAAGYGFITGSIVLNRKAVNTMNSIDDLDDANDIKEAFNNSVRQDNVSELFAYTAIGIWVTDIIWTIAGTSDLKKLPLYSEARGLSFKCNLDPVSNVPLVSMSYRF
ncbi:MAG: hypothetical protein KAR19_18255 [Bacteroidales bacterium]|nr:hypothetical protein [Bacteroidales bacterium]